MLCSGEMRMPTRPAPIAAATAVATSMTKRARFSGLPPYSSVRWLDAGREELVQQVAVGAVDLDAVQAGGDRALRGGDDVGQRGPHLVGGQRVRHGVGLLPAPPARTSPWMAIALGATIRSVPVTSGCETRPPCMTCMTMRPPRACTASATRRQPATCSSVTMPGWPG